MTMMDKVCNEEGYVVYYNYEGLIGTAVYINDEIIYGLPKGRWKKYRVKNYDFSYYEDSEGNFWDKTHKSAFPFSQNSLDVEVLQCALEHFNKQVEVLNNVKVQYNVNDLDDDLKGRFNDVYLTNYRKLSDILDKVNKLLNKLGTGLDNIDEDDDDLPF